MVPGDGGGAFAAHTAHNGGDALFQGVGAAEIALQPHVVMAVYIDEARGQHLSRAVDDVGRLSQAFSDAGDDAVLYRHIGVVHGVAGAVGDPGVFDEDVIHGSCSFPA